MRMFLVILSLAAFPFAAAAADSGTALTDDQCAATWQKAGGADLTADKAAPFIKDFKQVDVDQNGAINWEEFKAGCKNGLVSG